MAARVIKIVLICLAALILLCAAGFCAYFFRYYPGYKAAEKPADMERDPSADVSELGIMSVNLRCVNTLDTGRRSWFLRAELIMRNLSAEKPDIIGFQEATKTQYGYLTRTLPGYDSLILYRDSSPIAEGCPLFWRADMFELEDGGSFWLSDTPGVKSKFDDAAFNRVCTYAVLRNVYTNGVFAVFNTHLDHVGDSARVKGIKVILDRINAVGAPCLIMGDFNAVEGSETYLAATEAFDDARYAAAAAKNADGCTYQGFGENLDDEPIDFFMLSRGGWDVRYYETVDRTCDGAYPSDHFPIYIKAIVR